ncbi:hypothetical protein VNO77_20280 [Canavalia gladiata]|uniref:Uncharacterized protein n=1 Tax=Canavalia gladiata TaxID=3824 RepID=A0AAN9QLA8_CANGL
MHPAGDLCPKDLYPGLGSLVEQARAMHMHAESSLLRAQLQRPRRRVILRSSADLCRTIDSLFLLILLPRILLLSFSPIPPILGFDGIFFLQNRATMGDVTFPKIEHAVASVSGVQGRIRGSGSSHLTETCPKLVLIGAGETDATKLELLGS